MKKWLNYRSRLWRSTPLHDWLFTLVITLGVFYGMHAMAIGHTPSWRLHDLMLRWAGFHARSDIVVIAIDDRSLEKMQQWPLARKYYAQLLTRL